MVGTEDPFLINALFGDCKSWDFCLTSQHSVCTESYTRSLSENANLNSFSSWSGVIAGTDSLPLKGQERTSFQESRFSSETIVVQYLLQQHTDSTSPPTGCWSEWQSWKSPFHVRKTEAVESLLICFKQRSIFAKGCRVDMSIRTEIGHENQRALRQFKLLFCKLLQSIWLKKTKRLALYMMREVGWELKPIFTYKNLVARMLSGTLTLNGIPLQPIFAKG